MALYAIGDIQGCFCELQALLEQICFNPDTDQLWFTGDLVNRGPHSLDTLRFVRDLGDAAVTVLGNHDLHLLAIAARASRLRRSDTLQAVLQAPDREALLDWLRQQPLLHQAGEYCLIHAGLPPQWSVSQAQTYAREVESVLRKDTYSEFFSHMYGDTPDIWSPELSGWKRLRFITNCLTRLRYCDADGRMDFAVKSSPGHQPAHLMPWFKVPARKSAASKIVFGHWSTLGFYSKHNVLALDTGCLWGGQLTAVRLETARTKRISVDCPGAQKPVSPA